MNLFLKPPSHFARHPFRTQGMGTEGVVSGVERVSGRVSGRSTTHQTQGRIEDKHCCNCYWLPRKVSFGGYLIIQAKIQPMSPSQRSLVCRKHHEVGWERWTLILSVHRYSLRHSRQAKTPH